MKQRADLILGVMEMIVPRFVCSKKSFIMMVHGFVRGLIGDALLEVMRSNSGFVKTVVGNVLLAASNAFLWVVSVRVANKNMEPSQVGILVAMMAGMTSIAMLDFGIANQVMNDVSEARVNRGKRFLNGMISRRIVQIGTILSAILIGSEILLYLGFRCLGCGNLAVEKVAAWGMIILSAPMLVFNNFISRIYFGLQRGYIACWIGFVFNVVAMLIIISSSPWRSPVVLFLVAGLVPQFSWVVMVFRLRSEGVLVWEWREFCEQGSIVALVQKSIPFGLLQLGGAVIGGLDIWIIGGRVGAAAYAHYVIAQRPYLWLVQSVILFVGPLWPCLSALNAQCRYRELNQTAVSTLRRVLCIVGVVGGGVGLGSHWVYELMNGSVRGYSLALALVLPLWACVESTGLLVSTVMNSVGMVRQQVVLMAIWIGVMSPLKYWLSGLLGGLGVIVVHISSYVLIVLVGYGWLYQNWKREVCL